jgi:hypothetical protein
MNEDDHEEFAEEITYLVPFRKSLLIQLALTITGLFHRVYRSSSQLAFEYYSRSIDFYAST